MEQKVGIGSDNWKGERGKSGFYRIRYGEPFTIREILSLGMRSAALRIFLVTLLFVGADLLFSYYTYSILNFLRGKDLLFLFLGLLIVAGSFFAGKKFGRGYAIVFKWVGIPLFFLGFLSFVLTRWGFAAFWIGPVDLFTGTTSQALILEQPQYGAFHKILELLSNLKASLLRVEPDGSIFTVLVTLYRHIASSMNFYAVVPVLIVISLAIFAGTLLLVHICGVLVLLIPALACFGLVRLLRLLDERL